MEWNPETQQFLSQCFLNMLSPIHEIRRGAEHALASAEKQHSYPLAVLRLVAEPTVDEQIRQPAAINFKNHIKSHWISSSPGLAAVSDHDKNLIKALIVTLMVNSSPRIRRQVSEALMIIGKHDFPKSWQNLLPELVANLGRFSQVNDYVSINGVLSTINSLFKRFRYEFKIYEVLVDLKYCIDSFSRPLLEVFQRTTLLINQAVNSGEANGSVRFRGYIESQRLCCRIFYSLNYMELPEFFEDHMDEWMVEFRRYLTVRYPVLEDGGNDGLALVDGLRAAICENITLYMEKEEDLFQNYINGFAEAVWGLLVAASNSSIRERITVTAIKFLTTVSKSVHHALFARDDILEQIVQGIVIPNLMLRDEDEELFEMNYVEFMRRDVEGSDQDTRRRIACELLKGIALNYNDMVMQKISIHVKSLLASFMQNPVANWKHKECANYLVVSFCGSTNLVDVESFFSSVILPELQSQDINAFPMLKAGSLKFLNMFSNRIPKPVTMSLFQDLLRFIGSEFNVVHSYASSCIEKLLLVGDGGKPRYSATDINPFLLALITNLFGALQMQESQENEYVMKCIMGVLGVANIAHEIALPCINSLATILERVCQNPKNPVFNRYLFESMALLIKRACERDPSLVSCFENNLMPIWEIMLLREVTEFYPYALQLLTQLVDLNGNPLTVSYMQRFRTI